MVFLYITLTTLLTCTDYCIHCKVNKKTTKQNRKKKKNIWLMHSGTTNHVGKNLHLTDNAQHVLHSIIVAKEFFIILKGKIFAFGTKMLKNRWQRLNRWIFLLLCLKT